MPNHLTGINVASVLPDGIDKTLYIQRAVVTKKLKPVGIEAIARGYLIGSGWKDYQRTGKVSGIQLPDGLQEAEKLPDPIFTPSTKAAVGHHDENIDFDTTVKMVGAELAERAGRHAAHLPLRRQVRSRMRHPTRRYQVGVWH